jgi:hypothetical protein
VASLLALSGCGSSKPASPPPPSFDPVPGPRIDGELVFQCGADPLRLELFSLADGRLRRLTAGSRVSSFSVHGDTIAISRDGADFFAGLQVELTSLEDVPLRGEGLGAGQLVTLRDSRTIAFTRVDGHSSGLLWDVVYVRRVGSRARRVAEYRHLWQLTYVRGRLYAVVGEKRRYFLVRDVGTPRERRTRLRTNNATRAALARSGRAAYTDSQRGPLEAVHVGARTFTTDWAPKAWTTDGRAVLVTRGPELGFMDARTGDVRSAGRVTCGDVYDVALVGRLAG